MDDLTGRRRPRLRILPPWPGRTDAADDPHQHCDRDPRRCSYHALIDRYRTALATIEGCQRCSGCRMVAYTALSENYEPD